MTSTATAPAVARETQAPLGERLIRTICLTVQPMTREAFAIFGDVIDARGEIDLDLDAGRAAVSAQTVESRPMSFDFLGRHQRTEQIFSPLGGSQSVLAVAPADETNPDLPDMERMAAFLVDGSNAFKLNRGVWHTAAFPLESQATFLVMDRERTLEDDFDLRDLKTSLGVVVEIQK
jgi:ureidoglycolate lyase